MTLQLFSQSSKLVRFALTGLIATQAAIATTVISEFALTTPGIDSAHAALAKGERLSAQEIYRKAAPAIVYIEAKGTKERATGSGVIIQSNGLIVTNAHVVEGARKVTVELSDGRELPAKVVSLGRFNCLDLALLQIQATKLPTVNFAAANSVQKGEDVFAIGYPKGIKPSSITGGRVSNVFRKQGWIQTDATLNYGNSGGALLNDRGELLGINSRFLTEDTTGMNIAVAVEQVQALVQASTQGLSPILGKFVIPTTSQSNDAVPKLSLNGTKSNGTLQKSDHLMCNDGSHADLYIFKGEADQPVEISMSGSQIDSYLLLLGPNGESIDGESVKRGGVAKILTKLPEAGTYTVIAKAQRREQLGAYELRATVPLLAEQGSINRNSPRLPNGSPYSSYSFTGKADQAIDVHLYRFDFEPYLILQDAEGKVVAEGKASRGVVFSTKLSRNGFYTLIVRAVNSSDRGKFFLSVHSSPSTQPSQVSQKR